MDATGDVAVQLSLYVPSSGDAHSVRSGALHACDSGDASGGSDGGDNAWCAGDDSGVCTAASMWIAGGSTTRCCGDGGSEDEAVPDTIAARTRLFGVAGPAAAASAGAAAGGDARALLPAGLLFWSSEKAAAATTPLCSPSTSSPSLDDEQMSVSSTCASSPGPPAPPLASVSNMSCVPPVWQGCGGGVVWCGCLVLLLPCFPTLIPESDDAVSRPGSLKTASSGTTPSAPTPPPPVPFNASVGTGAARGGSLPPPPPPSPPPLPPTPLSRLTLEDESLSACAGARVGKVGRPLARAEVGVATLALERRMLLVAWWWPWLEPREPARRRGVIMRTDSRLTAEEGRVRLESLR